VSELCATTRLTILSGDDSLTLPMLAVGARGVISVAGNLIPRPLAAMLDAFDKGSAREAARIHLGLYPLMKGLFLETNPGPIKHVLARAGMIREEFRLPLVPVTEKTAAECDRLTDEAAIFLEGMCLA
jgi:4-hydroxy-tetrahydrodipicolinate synthase